MIIECCGRSSRVEIRRWTSLVHMMKAISQTCLTYKSTICHCYTDVFNKTTENVSMVVCTVPGWMRRGHTIQIRSLWIFRNFLFKRRVKTLGRKETVRQFFWSCAYHRYVLLYISMAPTNAVSKNCICYSHDHAFIKQLVCSRKRNRCQNDDWHSESFELHTARFQSVFSF
jgi:hypothetical protein